MPADPITRFSGRWRDLNNFGPARVVLDGDAYPSVEHGFVAAKTLDLALRRPLQIPETMPPDVRREMDLAGVRFIHHPGEAKRYGRRLDLRPDWRQAKVGIMLGLLRQKFRDPERRELLLSTGDAELVEGNTWGDQYWGCTPPTGRTGPFCHGLNVLGMLLEQVRGELLAASILPMGESQATAVLLGQHIIGREVRMQRPASPEEADYLNEGLSDEERPERTWGMRALVVGVTYSPARDGRSERVWVHGDEGFSMLVHGEHVHFAQWAWWVDGERQEILLRPDTSIRVGP